MFDAGKTRMIGLPYGEKKPFSSDTETLRTDGRTDRQICYMFVSYVYRLQICHCVQLYALFCCLWRKVEASCHKRFIVFSHNQHRRLLPAMCHNLQVGGRRPPATLMTTPGMLQR